MNTWTVAKGILLATAILTAIGYLMSVAMLGSFNAHINQEITETRRQQVAPEKNEEMVRAKAVAVKKARFDTPTGVKLGRECDDWLNTLADYDYPSTRQGARKACGRYERYLATGR